MDVSMQYHSPQHLPKELISQQELAHVLDSRGFSKTGHWLSKLAMDVFKLNDINEIYEQHANISGLQFVESVLNHLCISIEIDDAAFTKIPARGGYVIVSNHPLGLLDGLILIKIFAHIHPNIKILANHLLQRIENLKPFIIPVNPYETSPTKGNNSTALKSAIQHVRDGNPLIIFPAGEVSSFQMSWPAQISDCDWKTSIIKMVRSMGVPVLPVYMHAKNSFLFYMLAGMNPMLKSAAIPGEFVKSKGKSVKVIIGHAVQKGWLDKYKSAADIASMLKLKTYFLENCLHPTPLAEDTTGNLEDLIKDKMFKKSVADEMNLFLESNPILIENEKYQVVAGKLNGFNCTMKYISLAREVTFRSVGEGTMQDFDTDSYDLYYEHLILWDRQNSVIAGSYRLGFGSEIMENKGIAGFYTSQLFKYGQPMGSLLIQCMEIGRSFILKEYQQKPTTLLLLWKGIVAIASQRKNISYIFGAVSISNQYSLYSKSLIIQMLDRHYKDSEMAQYVKPKNEFETKIPKWSDSLLTYFTKEDISQYDLLIRDIENNRRGIPILIKKYLSLNAFYAGCSVDPDFNHCLDTLMFIKMDTLVNNPLFRRKQQC